MAGAGLTAEKLRVMDAVRRLPVVAAELDGVAPHAVPRVACEVLCAALRDLGDGVHARLLRTAFGIDYAGSAKDLTARRLEFVAAHNAAERAARSRNVLPSTPRALYAIEQQMLEAVVTALGASSVDPVPPDAGHQPGPVGAVAAVPRHLPAAPARFCGRADALAWLDARALVADAERGVPTVVAVHGTAGVGKTALALHWAHAVADRFPDGQLYIDLRGHAKDCAPVTPWEALSRLLGALGVVPNAIPADEEQRVGAYRSATAGKQLLVVLDNAATSEQVAPLVPGTPGCTVVVTSRNALPGLVVSQGADVLTLDVLAPGDAVALFAALLGADRTQADPTATAAVAALCGRLPLALRIVAAKLQAEPEATLGDMEERLRATDRLSALGFENDGEVAVRTAFALSYDSLADDVRRAFRLLALVPGADVTAETAGALLGTDTATADRLLDRLVAGHLIARSAQWRFQFHDLLREYATELTRATDSDSDRDAALDRLLGYYVHRAGGATTLLHASSLRVPGDRPDLPAPEPLPDRDAAIGWLERERANLTAAVVHAGAHGHTTAAWQLAFAMRGCFLIGASGADLLPIGTVGLAAAESERHLHAASAMHAILGRAHRQLGDLSTAARHVGQALARSQEAEWTAGEIVARCTLGVIHEDQGRLADAITHHEAALDLSRRHGDPARGATHLVNIGSALCRMGRFSDAAPYCTEALDIMRAAGDERGIGFAREMLGLISHQFGKFEEAARDFELALAAYRGLDFRDLEAECLSAFARLQCDVGDLPAARGSARASLRLARTLDDVRLKVIAANALGEIALRGGDPAAAQRQHRAALGLAAGIGYRLGRVGARVGLAAAAVAGAADDARALAEEAVADAAQGGFLALEARALTVLGRARLALGDGPGAFEAASRALDRHLDGGSAIGVAEAEALLSLCDATGTST
jgi:tetratricopeptide (TPR) repeat protein